MSFTFAKYEDASRDTGRSRPGAIALMAYCRARWPFVSNLGIYEPRNIGGTTTLSHHAEGRALDLGIKQPAKGKADRPKGMLILDALGPRGEQLGIDHLIWDEVFWSARKPGGRPHTGDSPHHDHIHIGLSRIAADTLTGERIETILGGVPMATPPAAASIPGATHTANVRTTLNVRSTPSLDGPSVGAVAAGAGVAVLSTATVESGGFTWANVRAIIDGRPQEGWAAQRFLAPVPASHPASHVVVVAGHLKLRSRPSLSGAELARLPDGTGVHQLPDAAVESDGHRWVKVRTEVAGRAVEGWVASRFLKPTG